MIRVENKRTYRGAGVYIGRPSLLGNPFEIGVHGEREDVIRFYRQWLWERILDQGEVCDLKQKLAQSATHASNPRTPNYASTQGLTGLIFFLRANFCFHPTPSLSELTHRLQEGRVILAGH